MLFLIDTNMRIKGSFTIVFYFAMALQLLLPIGLFSQTNQEIQQYIATYKNIAIFEMSRAKVPASITLAQGIHESGAGTSVLCRNTNNHFGIKCHKEWQGETYRHDDDAPQECFRVYKDPAYSYFDHSEFLRSRKWYQPLFALAITDYKGWAYGLKKAGYATNPKYPQIIIKLIEDYQLWQYDYDSLTADSLQHYHTATDTLVKKESVTSLPPVIQNLKILEQNTLQLEKIKVNGVEGIVWDGIVPLETIAASQNNTVTDLKLMNDLYGSKGFKNGDVIYLQHKKAASEYWQYEIGNGETMWQIAQKFAIKLDSLYLRNGLKWGDEPEAGEVLVLRGEREVPIRSSAIRHHHIAAIPATAATNPKSYFVQKGDTLYQIAKKFNTDVATLIQLNKLSTNQLNANQLLLLP